MSSPSPLLRHADANMAFHSKITFSSLPGCTRAERTCRSVSSDFVSSSGAVNGSPLASRGIDLPSKSPGSLIRYLSRIRLDNAVSLSPSVISCGVQVTCEPSSPSASASSDDANPFSIRKSLSTKLIVSSATSRHSLVGSCLDACK